MKFRVWRKCKGQKPVELCRYGEYKNALLELQRHGLAQAQGQFPDCRYHINRRDGGRDHLMIAIGPWRGGPARPPKG